MVYARRNSLPSHVKLNRAGAISISSFVKNLGLEDGVIFGVEVNEDTKTLTLTPTDLVDFPEQ